MDKKTIKLLQNAYFAYDEWEGHYEADATDLDDDRESKYVVEWEIVDAEAEDGMDVCDWDIYEVYRIGNREHIGNQDNIELKDLSDI